MQELEISTPCEICVHQGECAYQWTGLGRCTYAYRIPKPHDNALDMIKERSQMEGGRDVRAKALSWPELQDLHCDGKLPAPVPEKGELPAAQPDD